MFLSLEHFGALVHREGVSGRQNGVGEFVRKNERDCEQQDRAQQADDAGNLCVGGFAESSVVRCQQQASGNWGTEERCSGNLSGRKQRDIRTRVSRWRIDGNFRRRVRIGHLRNAASK